MKILITGATGLVGQEIVKLCHQCAIDVHYLTTNSSKLKSKKNYQGFLWDPIAGSIDTDCFEDVEVIIHLVGATIAKRWTSSYRKEIVDSRVKSTELLVQSLKERKHSIRHIIAASAIGIYPDSFQNYYTEDEKNQETGFLGEVVQKWEHAIAKFHTIDIEVAMLRIGLVLSDKGGAFPKIVSPIRQGVGAVFGNGKQWQSWIHVTDLARLFMFVLEQELTGVFNAVAPNPVSNQKMTNSVANRLGKKIILPNVPRFVMNLVLGDMHILLYGSQRVSSEKIVEAGFGFQYKNISQAVENLVHI